MPPPVPTPDQIKSLDLRSLLDLYFQNLKDFTAAINVGFDPLNPNDYTYYIFRLQEGLSGTRIVGVLPGLYGMLGAVIFHMRRLLDPTLPNPSWLRFAYRIVLGGFAEIVLVWFWTPSSTNKLAQPAFATLTSFGFAFLVGFIRMFSLSSAGPACNLYVTSHRKIGVIAVGIGRRRKCGERHRRTYWQGLQHFTSLHLNMPRF